MKNVAIIEALSGLSAENALALEPVLRRMAHDLNGAMTPLTLEAGELEEASEHLRSTAARISTYLADAHRVLERRGDVT